MSIAIISRSLQISGTGTGTVVTVLLLVTKQTPPPTCVLNIEKLEFPSKIKESGIESFSHVSVTAAISKRSVLNKSENLLTYYIICVH